MLQKYAIKTAANLLTRKFASHEGGGGDTRGHERGGRLGRKVAALGAVGLAGMFGWQGVERAMEHNKIVTTESVAQGGEAGIIAFNADFEEHCWTATTLGVKGAGTKTEAKALGASVGWRELKVDTEVKNNACVESTSLEFALDRKTGHVDINIPSKNAIKTRTEVVLGSIRTHEDQTIGYAFADNITNFLESVPFVEDIGISQDLTAAQDKTKSFETNVALTLAAYESTQKCASETWNLAKEPVAAGIKRMASLGLRLAQAQYPEINPDDISVLVEGRPISELELPGRVTSIDDAYSKIKEFDDKNESFSIITSSQDDCKVSADVQNIPTESPTVVKAGQLVGVKG